MVNNAINTTQLTRKFGDVTAVNNITFKVSKGELFGLLGPNGAGKTTLLRLLTGQLESSHGTAKVLGVDPSANPLEIKRRIGIVPEIESPPSFLTPREYLLFIGLIRDLKKMETRADHWLKFLDLINLQNVPNKDLSKGEKQKVMLAAAFIHEPALLFLDEPFMGLDPYYQKHVKDYLKNYISNGGTIFMCTHILELAEKMCTRIAIIDHGKIIVSGKLDELTEKDETLDKAFLRYTKRKI
jgi:ABC-2 type transport system ATP-binding protein